MCRFSYGKPRLQGHRYQCGQTTTWSFENLKTVTQSTCSSMSGADHSMRIESQMDRFCIPQNPTTVGKGRSTMRTESEVYKSPKIFTARNKGTTNACSKLKAGTTRKKNLASNCFQLHIQFQQNLVKCTILNMVANAFTRFPGFWQFKKILYKSIWNPPVQWEECMEITTEDCK